MTFKKVKRWSFWFNADFKSSHQTGCMEDGEFPISRDSLGSPVREKRLSSRQKASADVVFEDISARRVGRQARITSASSSVSSFPDLFVSRTRGMRHTVHAYARGGISDTYASVYVRTQSVRVYVQSRVRMGSENVTRLCILATSSFLAIRVYARVVSSRRAAVRVLRASGL